jgi:hypothetical protein
MADPLELAAEELAPARAATSFFDQKANPALRAASAGRRLEDQKLISGELSGLADSRLQRRLRRREEVLMDREDQQYEAKQAFLNRQGEFLSEVSRLNPFADDYGQVRNNLVTSLPPGALKNEGIRSILSFQDAQNKDYIQGKEDEQRNERIAVRSRQRMVDEARATFLRLGGDPESFQGMLTPEGNLDFDKIMGASGKLERRAKAAGGVKSATRAQLEDQIKTLVADPGVFPVDEETLESETLNALIIRAARIENPDDFVDQVPGLSPEGKKIRKEVWDLSRQIVALGRPGVIGDSVPVQTSVDPEVEEEKEEEKKDEDQPLINNLLDSLPTK